MSWIQFAPTRARLHASVQSVLEVTPETLHFAKDQTALTLVIANAGTGTMSWSLTDYPDWLSITPGSGTTTTEQDQITVTVNKEKLPSGTYSGSLTVRSDSGAKQIQITVDYPRLQVDVSELQFGTSQTEQYLNVTNAGTGTLDWQLTESIECLIATPSSGSTTTETDQIRIKVSREGYAVNSSPYSGQIQISSIYGGSATVRVTMAVPEPDIRIVSGPSDAEEIQVLPVVITFEAADIEGQAEFSWRLNTGGKQTSWSDWSRGKEVSLDDLDESSLAGQYEFQVRSRSAAGDVDNSPASRKFTVNAIQGPALWLTSRSVETTSGSEFLLRIVAEEVVDLMLAHLVIKFDPSKLELVSVEKESAFLEKSGGTVVWPEPRQNADSVDISAGIAIGSPPGVDGTGTVGRLRFKANAAGTTAVRFDATNTELRNHNNERIELRSLTESEIVVQ